MRTLVALALAVALLLPTQAFARLPSRFGDRDGDGLSNYFERQVLGTNPARADSDGDGWDDYYEYVFWSDPLDPADGVDDDGDGLYDLYEQQQGTSDTVADSDGDGWDDYYEYVYLSDPLDPASTP